MAYRNVNLLARLIKKRNRKNLKENHYNTQVLTKNRHQRVKGQEKVLD